MSWKLTKRWHQRRKSLALYHQSQVVRELSSAEAALSRKAEVDVGWNIGDPYVSIMIATCKLIFCSHEGFLMHLSPKRSR